MRIDDPPCRSNASAVGREGGIWPVDLARIGSASCRSKAHGLALPEADLESLRVVEFRCNAIQDREAARRGPPAGHRLARCEGVRLPAGAGVQILGQVRPSITKPQPRLAPPAPGPIFPKPWLHHSRRSFHHSPQSCSPGRAGLRQPPIGGRAASPGRRPWAAARRRQLSAAIARSSRPQGGFRAVDPDRHSPRTQPPVLPGPATASRAGGFWHRGRPHSSRSGSLRRRATRRACRIARLLEPGTYSTDRRGRGQGGGTGRWQRGIVGAAPARHGQRLALWAVRAPPVHPSIGSGGTAMAFPSGRGGPPD